jgi:hypothetical protein
MYKPAVEMVEQFYLDRMERLLFNTKRHRNIAFRVSSPPNIRIKSTPPPSSRWGYLSQT